MRKIGIVLLSLLLLGMFVMPGFSQVQFKKGVKGGLNLANLGGSDVENTDNKTGFSFGVFAALQLANLIYFQPEILYTMKGAKQKFDFGGETIDVSIKLNYIEIPLLIRLNVPVQGASFAPNLFAGPAIAFNLSAKVKAEGGGESSEVDIKDDTKSTDFGLIVGVGSAFGPLVLDIRYILGLSSIDDSAEKADVKNRVISFNAGIAL